MCGIAGACNFSGSVDRQLVKRMTRILEHRGPDAEGFFFDRAVGLGSRRLSIIDLSSKANQPLCNEDKSVFVVCNGEIYNFLELRAQLERKGHKFSSNSDSEVIVHGFEEFGKKCFGMLRGMFAIALWDARNKELFLVRDRIGIKPLFFGFVDGALLFGSEQKAILECREFERRINLPKIKELARLDYSRGSETIFEGIYQLKPSHYLNFCKSGVAEKRYFELQVSERKEPEKKLVAELRSLLQESMKLHLQSDVPVGVFLSGGIDSSSVTTLASRLYKNIHTYTIGFGEFYENELKHARMVADACGTIHKEIVLDAPDLETMKKVVWHLDQPMSDLATVPIFLMSEQAVKDVKVVLTGEGNDELWAGYEHFSQVPYYYNFGKSLPGFVKEFLVKAATAMPNCRLRTKAWFLSNLWKDPLYLEARKYYFTGAEEKRMFSKRLLAASDVLDRHLLAPNLEKASLLNRLLVNYLDGKLLNAFLIKIDRMTMAHGLEARVPWLDNRIIDFAFSVPCGLKIHNGVEKYLFRKAMEPFILKPTFKKKKRGFGVPYHLWLNQNRDELLSVVSEKTIAKRGLFKSGYVKKLLEKKSFSIVDADRLWSMLMLELWQQIYLD